MSGALVVADHLRKSYKAVEAVRDLSFQVPEGSVTGFLGRNGAGKTTTIKMLLGIARPDYGSIRIFDLDAASERDSIAIRQRVAYVSETKELYPYMDVEQAIRFTRSFFPRWRADLERRYLDLFELPSDRKVTRLSRGMRTKFMLLLALARGAELLILDEPTEGLDPAATEEVLQALMALAADEGTTILFSSHQLAEVEQIADRVCIIDQGKTVIESSLDDLKESCRRLRVVFDSEVPPYRWEQFAVGPVVQEGRVLSLLVRDGTEETAARVREMKPRSVELLPVTLKDIFLDATKGKR